MRKRRKEVNKMVGRGSATMGGGARCHLASGHGKGRSKKTSWPEKRYILYPPRKVVL
jgi:hypothetical protein